MILEFHRLIGWKNLKEICLNFTVLELTNNGELSSNGKMMTLTKFQSLITTKLKDMAKLENIHPGEILKEEFLLPLGISAYKLAKETFMPQTRISEILKGRRRITADTALRLSKFFGTSAKFWLGLQDDYDLEEEQFEVQKELKKIKPNSENAA